MGASFDLVIFDCAAEIVAKAYGITAVHGRVQ